jgi:hypothetical protein
MDELITDQLSVVYNGGCRAKAVCFVLLSDNNYSIKYKFVRLEWRMTLSVCLIVYICSKLMAEPVT